MATRGVLVLLASGFWGRLAAQVGHPPDHSPYHDVRVGSAIEFTGGYLSGSRGVVGVGPSDGDIFGVRYSKALGGVLAVTIGLADGLTSRYVIDPTKDSSTRTTGPANTSIVVADLGMQVFLTGGKSWHGLIPSFGFSGGLAYSGRAPGDTSQYTFGTKATLEPELGLRWYVAPRLTLRAGAKLVLWRLSYPLEYHVAPTLCTSGCTSVIPVSQSLAQWTAHPWLSLGVGWTF